MGAMSSPTDTTLGERRGRAVPLHRQLVTVCVAARPLAAPARFELRGGTTELGRASGPEVLGLGGDPRVSRRHATVVVSDARATITPSGDAHVEVDGEPVVGERALESGDAITLGESILVYRESTGPFESPPPDDGIVGSAPAMIALRRAVAKVGRAEVTVLLLGESGTGKEVVARALHQRSARKGQFVAVNCAAIPESLAEAHLFGHVAGAFTGAQRASAGVFRAADGGTLFLDELGDLPLELQPKLLRALEERKVTPVGSTTASPIDVRVVTATHHDLFDDVQSGRFRGDLYARVAEYVMHLPPLRARREDVLVLLRHLYGGPLPAIDFSLLRALVVHPWPFNVRELRTAASQLKLAAMDDAILDAHAIELRGTTPRPERSSEPAAPAPAKRRAEGKPPDRAELEALLRAHRGNVAELARAQGRSRKQVYRWLEALELDAERYRRE